MAAWDSSSHTSLGLACSAASARMKPISSRASYNASRQGGSQRSKTPLRGRRAGRSEGLAGANLHAPTQRWYNPPQSKVLVFEDSETAGASGANRGLVVFLSRHYPAAPPPFSFLVPQSRRFVRFGRSAEPSDRRATWLAKRSAIARIRRFVHDRRMPKMAASSRHGARPPRRLLAELSKVVMLQL